MNKIFKYSCRKFSSYKMTSPQIYNINEETRINLKTLRIESRHTSNKFIAIFCCGMTATYFGLNIISFLFFLNYIKIAEQFLDLRSKILLNIDLIQSIEYNSETKKFIYYLINQKSFSTDDYEIGEIENKDDVANFEIIDKQNSLLLRLSIHKNQDEIKIPGLFKAFIKLDKEEIKKYYL